MESLKSIIAYIAEEGRVILEAPAAFLTILAIAVGLVWIVLNWRFSGQIDNLNSSLKLKDDTISNYKDKLSGATPEEARRRLDALALQVEALSPRRLSNEQKSAVSQMARATSGSSIAIQSDMAVADAKAFANDLALSFQDAGWTVELPMVWGIGNPPPTGVGLRVSDSARLTAPERAAQLGLEAAKIAFDVQHDPGSPSPRGITRQTDVQVLITSH